MKDHIEDLSAHSRRGELGESGVRRLSLALKSSYEARLLHQAGREFDRLDSVLPGDDALTKRVIHRVLKLRDGTRRRRRRYIEAALTTVAWTAAAAAAAPLLIASQVIPPQVSASFVAKRSGSSVVKVRNGQVFCKSNLTAPSPQPRDDLHADSSVPQALSEPQPVRQQVQAAQRPSEAPLKEATTSAQAFAQANRLRRTGHSSEAIAQYVALQRSFPDSEEARNADIALGMLRLQSGSASLALNNFHRYLEKNASSQMVPEALWGEAQALAALGRNEAARQGYASLLKRYPESAYASAARAKLQIEP